jgi:hypothetical protein
MSRHRSGEGYQNISAELKVPKDTVVSILLKCKFGATKTLPRAGHLAKMSNQGRRALVREMTECQSVEMGEPSRRTTISAALHQTAL